MAKSRRNQNKTQPSNPAPIIGTSDDLLIASRSGEIQLEHEKKPAYVGQYYTYNDFVPPSRPWSGMTEKEWRIMLGFLLIRVFAPMILILHTLAIVAYSWFKYRFRFDEAELAAKVPWLMTPLCGNLLIVQFLSKVLFRRNYYRQRDVKV
ncbi:DEKNAAC101164 [Brettanomyces naardenensis]|uniref:DEKNAAC101164 n=1 Tax=Brettanomyces naardenensis TaxID=13370 RepID=A0A448YHD8_BRENA|nr:DEKNAAC101164 [Brettanomyces naardenensis]